MEEWEIMSDWDVGSRVNGVNESGELLVDVCEEKEVLFIVHLPSALNDSQVYIYEEGMRRMRKRVLSTIDVYKSRWETEKGSFGC